MVKAQERGTVRKCKKCGEVKPLDLYYKSRKAVCKSCHKAETKAYRDANLDRVLERDRSYYADNREQILAKKREYGQRPEVREHYRKTRKVMRRTDDEYAETIRKRNRKYYRKNRPAALARWAKRRSALLDRTPAWADDDAIKFFYECRPMGCHVDHVIPLQGKRISGLHVETNLQWLPATKNLRKHNKLKI